MAFDSQITNPSSMTHGTLPFGLSFRYSGLSLPPNGPPMSLRSNSMSHSSHSHVTFWTLLDVARPRIVSICAPSSVIGVRKEELPQTDIGSSGRYACFRLNGVATVSNKEKTPMGLQLERSPLEICDVRRLRQKSLDLTATRPLIAGFEPAPQFQKD